MARLSDLLNSEQIGQIPGQFGYGQGAFQRAGGELVNLGQQQPSMGDLPLDYANPLDYMGTKGFRLKGDSSRALLEDGRIIDLIPGRQQAYQQQQLAQQEANAKAERDALDMEIKRADLEAKRAGDWHIDSSSGMMINKKNGEIRRIETGGQGGQITPGSVEERLAAGYAQRMALADDLMRDIGEKGYQDEGRAIAGAIPFIGDYLARKVGSDEQGRFSQAQSDWVRAKLRKESGAAIGDDEMAKEISTYFPMPGDSPATIEQKAQARQIANEAMKMAAGKAAVSVTGRRPNQPQSGSSFQDPDKEARYQEWKRSRGL